MAVHVLGGGVGNDISAPLERAAVDRSCKCVVNDQRNAVLMRSLRELLDVENSQGGVCDGLAENRLSVRLERRVQLLGSAVGAYEREINAHLAHGNVEQIERTAVDRAGSDYVVSAACDVEHREEVRSLTRRSQHCGGTALKLGYLSGNGVVRGVLKAGVEVSAGFKVEQLAHVLTGGVLEGGALDYRHLPGFAVSGSVASLDAFGSHF